MGYRILKEGEIIQEGDEVDISQHLNKEPVWVKTSCAGQLAPNPIYPAHRVYRRPTQIAAVTAETAEEKLCVACGHSEARHQTAGGFCKHCPCEKFIEDLQ